jgi:hypothetical protein
MKALILNSSVTIALISSVLYVVGLWSKSAYLGYFGDLNGADYAASMEHSLSYGFMILLGLCVDHFVFVALGSAIAVVAFVLIGKLKKNYLYHSLNSIVVLVGIFVLMFSCHSYGKKIAKEYHAGMNRGINLIHVTLSDGHEFNGMKIVCGEKICAFLTENKVLEIPRDRISKIESLAPKLSP